MDNIKKRRYKQLKRSHAWLPVVLFFITAFFLAFFAASFLLQFVSYIVEGKIYDEYHEVKFLAALYDKGVSEGSDVFAYLDASGRSYVIYADDGTELHRSGDMTDSGMERSMTLRVRSEDITVIPESGSKIFASSSDGRGVINVFGIPSSLHDYMSEEDIDRLTDEYDDKNIGIKLTELFDNPNIVYAPYSVEIKVAGGKMTAQAFLTLNMKDIYLFGTFVVIAAVLMLAIFVIMVVSIINSIVTSRRTLGVFFTDIVTNGHNQMWFMIKGQDHLQKHKNRGARFAVMNIVFVNYRNFCVCHSVAEGEKMLRKVYDVIRESVTKNEMCAHCTSSNFAALMRFTDRDALERRVGTMISRLEGIDSTRKFAFHVGIAIVEPDGTIMPDGTAARRRSTDIESEYNNACTARSKLESSDESGEALFDAKMTEEQKWVEAVQEHQASALANEEFLVYYQPKYDPSTDRLKGAEALIRWQSPEFGFVPPGRIIPIFEKNGFITYIDHYMISHVARDQKMWLDRGCGCVPVSVNVSRAHFIESDLAEQIRDMVDAEGCPHELVEIELTESAFFDDKKAMISTITKLKEYGFTVSMDDFGSGYSSLNSLKDMPLDVLKLDAEFFRGTSEDGRGEIVVAEAIKLAKSLNMRTVAEGVEVRDQVDFLAAQGCDMIQGYFYAKPMPRNDFEERMASGIKPKE